MLYRVCLTRRLILVSALSDRTKTRLGRHKPADGGSFIFATFIAVVFAPREDGRLKAATPTLRGMITCPWHDAASMRARVNALAARLKGGGS